MIKYALADLLISIGGAFDGELKKDGVNVPGS